MTDYGRGPRPEPWPPEDPGYGDQGWVGQQAADGGPAYGGQPQPYPGQGQFPQQQGQYYNGGQQQYTPSYNGPQQGGGPEYGQQSHPYPQQQYQEQQRYQGQPFQPQPQQPQQYNDPRYNGGWDTQQTAVPYGANPAETYPGRQGAGFTENPDYYGTPQTYPPQPSGRQQQEPAPARRSPEPPRQNHPEPENEWDTAQPEVEAHPFFTGADDHPDARGGKSRGERDDELLGDGISGEGDDGGRQSKPKKKGRAGTACLVIAVMMVGGVGGVAYYGYHYYQDRFGPPPDFSGTGDGSTVQIEVPDGASGYEIAALLVRSGVVKSQGAFVNAQNANPQGKLIQAGVYTLPKGMSGKSCVAAMLNPKSMNSLIIPPGQRTTWVYQQLDKRLGLRAGTTARVAKDDVKQLGLPSWADDSKSIKDPLEGFLYPASYPVAKGTKPEVLLKQMVARANAAFTKMNLVDETKRINAKEKLHLSPLDLLTVASLVQAEGKDKQDFTKIARVVYNRLAPNIETAGRLEFDSTINYIKEESTLHLGAVDQLRTINDPYNTYKFTGLPPGPIDNPGDEAIHSAIDPASGPWYYFVSVDENTTVFATTNAEQNRNRAKYEKNTSDGQ